MPNYDFECTGCKRNMERSLLIADRNLPLVCDSCGKPMKRLISGVQIQIPDAFSKGHFNSKGSYDYDG